MHLVHGAATDVGLTRTQNEDSYVVGGGLYAVCDGMGGARAGEVASDSACRHLLSLTDGKGRDEDLVDAVQAANREVLDQSRRDPALKGMGSTLTAALWEGRDLLIGHVGDSRAYLFRDDRLEQLTEDHSVVGEMERDGRLTPAEAERHPYRSILTRAVGTEDRVEVDIRRIAVQPGDRLLLCTDGLTGMLDDEDISRILEEGASPAAIAESLVAAALEGGGEDNITVVVLDVVEGEGSGRGGEDEAGVDLGPDERIAPSRALGGGPPGAERVLGPREGSDSGEALGSGEVSGTGGEKRVERSGAADWIRGRVLLGIVSTLLVLLLALGVLAVINSSVYFVGTSGGKVALYRGMPYAVIGVELYSVEEVGARRYEELDRKTREEIDAHDLTTKEDGQRFIRDLSTGE